MIHFACSGCGRSFTVPENFAGKKARCNRCGAAVNVPAAPGPLPTALPAGTAPSAEKRPSVRMRRLSADLAQLRQALDGNALVRIRETQGDPPELYRLEYHLRGIEKLDHDQPIFRQDHLVQLQMTAEYPRVAPQCKMLTPIFHPNIDASSICIGDHWVAGERLADLVLRIGEMIGYQAYNIKSPLNGEAAMWADLHPEQLPVDSQSLHPGAAAAAS